MTRGYFRPNEFEALHEEGARRFGHLWFLANRSLLRVAKNHRMDVIRHRDVLSDLAFELCEYYEGNREFQGNR